VVGSECGEKRPHARYAEFGSECPPFALPNVRARVTDSENLDVEPGSFDASANWDVADDEVSFADSAGRHGLGPALPQDRHRQVHEVFDN